MRLSTVINNEHCGLGNGREQENNRIQKRFFELHICTHLLILLQHIFQSNMIERIVIGKHKQNNLAEETYPKPFIKNSVGCSDVGYVLQRLCVRKVVKVYRCQNAHKAHLFL